MTKENFWSDAARCGAVLGLILSGSFLVETAFSLSGNGTLRNLVAVESVAVAVLHYYLLHRYTRQRSRLFSREEGFQFMHAYAFIQVISIFAGLLVGCTNFILTAPCDRLRPFPRTLLAIPCRNRFAGRQPDAPGFHQRDDHGTPAGRRTHPLRYHLQQRIYGMVVRCRVRTDHCGCRFAPSAVVRRTKKGGR